MKRIKVFINKNFEVVFVLSLIASIALLNVFVAQELAFLHFYFLPIIVSGYYLGWRRTVLSSFLCIVFITLYFILYPDHFIAEFSRQEIAVHLLIWGSFLIIAGAVVGRLQEKLQKETRITRELNKELLEKQEELRLANQSLAEDTDNLERMVAQKTSDLEESRNILEVMKGKVEGALYSAMDSSVAQLIIEGRLRDEKKNLSVMFTDLAGFTSYSETRQPEVVIRDLNRYFAEMEEIMFAYNAHLDKYQGDGIMCEFGTPVDLTNYRLMAVVCAIKMQEKMAASKEYPWKMRIGIASGMAIVGLIGAQRQAYTTIGDVVNLASRFEKAAPPGSILIDNNTLEGVRPFINVELKHDINLSDSLVREVRAKIREKSELLEEGNDHVKANLYHQIGQLHLAIMEPGQAVTSFEQALLLKPEDTNFKIAFAEATLQKDNHYKIQVRGKSERVAAYEVVGLKDPLEDQNKLTPVFREKYKDVVELIGIPEDFILPSEVLDGRVGHGNVVALLSYAMAGELGVESEEMKVKILQAGFLADVGLQEVPHHLLNRSKGGLSSDEYEEYMCHCIKSTNILKKKGFQDKQLLEMIYHSHEKYDGNGFPAGLRGEKIPIGARIIAVADTYNTLTSPAGALEYWGCL